MKRPTAAVLAMALFVSNAAGLSAQQSDVTQAPADYWYAYAAKLPIGSTVRVRTSDGKRHTAILMQVDEAGITLHPKTRIPEPPQRVSFDQLDQLELEKKRRSVGRIAAGVAVGVGVSILVVYLALLAAYSD